MKQITYFLLIGILCLACDSNKLSFEQPQPREAKNLNKIPSKLRGKYFIEEDSVFLYVTRNSIIKEGTYAFKDLLDSMMTKAESSDFLGNEQRKDTSIIIKEDGFEIVAEIEGDSIFLSVSGRNTLFEISETHLLRQSGQQYFMNIQRTNKTSWDVKSMTLINNTLLISSLPGNQNIDSLKSITEIETFLHKDGEVDHYKLNPTLRELLEIVKASKSSAKRYRKIN